MKAITWAAIGAAAFLLCAVCLAATATGKEEPAYEAPVAELLQRLQSAEEAERRAAMASIQALYGELQNELPEGGKVAALPVYQELAAGLVRIVGKEREQYDSDDEKLLAVLLLGEMRAAEAVDVLLDNLTFRPPRLIEEAGLGALYPCVEALIRIGQPSVEGILRRASRQYGDREIMLLSHIVRRVMGREDGLGRFEGELELALKRVDNLRDIVANLERE